LGNKANLINSSLKLIDKTILGGESLKNLIRGSEVFFIIKNQDSEF
jgi:hypothetical protein